MVSDAHEHVGEICRGIKASWCTVDQVVYRDGMFSNLIRIAFRASNGQEWDTRFECRVRSEVSLGSELLTICTGIAETEGICKPVFDEEL